jgi:hypothetical protein
VRTVTWLLAAAAAVALAACGPQASYGGPTPGPDPTGSPQCYPGDPRCDPTPSPTPFRAPSAPAPRATTQASPEPPPPQVTYFEIDLIAASPFYRAEGEAATVFTVPQGYVLRVTNRDGTPERPWRTFTAPGAFTSPRLGVGETWELHLTSTGTFQIVDECCPFIRAELRIR